ncbi:MAG: tyrosine-type recombinase/integrase [Myxococcales bacterium]|nr:tyrosine-type recombinase/integrase [Myxococcales bacterium]
MEEGLSLRTVASLEDFIKTFVKRSGARVLSEITLDRVRGFFYEGKERYQWSYWHYVNHRKYLKKFLDWCLTRGLVTSNPATKIRKPKKPQSLPRRLTYEQAQAILYASFNHPWRYPFERSRNHALIATLLFTGLRARELLGLELVDLNLEGSTLLVRAGKGNKDRYVPIHHKLRYTLGRYLEDRQRAGRTIPRLFTAVLQDRPLGYRGLGRVCRTLSRATGTKFTPHCLRHTFGSVSVEQNMHLVKLKEIMGHQDISSTMVYLRMAPAKLQESLDQLTLF